MKEVLILAETVSRASRLNVAAYCRVSSDGDEQRNSLENQQTYYIKRIQENPSWRNAGIYVESEPGKSMMKRREFKRLLTKCKKGKVDMIITKSVSRFSRNTVDALQVCHVLKALGVEVMFEKENLRLSNPATTQALEIPSPTGKAVWSREAINKLLKNEKITDDEYISVVRGTGSEPYQVTLNLAHARKSTCNCPMPMVE